MRKKKFPSRKPWRTANGKAMTIGQMTNKHLRNAINYLRAYTHHKNIAAEITARYALHEGSHEFLSPEPRTPEEFFPAYPYMIREAVRRGLVQAPTRRYRWRIKC